MTPKTWQLEEYAGSLKITVDIGGTPHTATIPYAEAKYVEVEGRWCECQEGPPLKLQIFKVVTHEQHRTGEARCLGCQGIVGDMVVESSTYSLREDAVMMSGRWRVY